MRHHAHRRVIGPLLSLSLCRLPSSSALCSSHAQLTLVPIEGYGTDCYITFNRLAHANSEYILPVPSVVEDDEVEEGFGLFDAQSRRMRKRRSGPRVPTAA